MTAAVGVQKLSAGTWAIDPIHSSINFSVRHLMVGKIHRRFDQFSGAITITEDGTPSVAAEIDVDSVDTGNEQREAHIKAADFFDVAQFPTATFVSTAVRADGDDYVLDGDFTLKGVTKPVALTLVFNGVNPGMGRGEVAGFDAAVVLSRKDFGVGAELPLDGGGTMVGGQGHDHAGARGPQAGLARGADGRTRWKPGMRSVRGAMSGSTGPSRSQKPTSTVSPRPDGGRRRRRTVRHGTSSSSPIRLSCRNFRRSGRAPVTSRGPRQRSPSCCRFRPASVVRSPTNTTSARPPWR